MGFRRSSRVKIAEETAPGCADGARQMVVARGVSQEQTTGGPALHVQTEAGAAGKGDRLHQEGSALSATAEEKAPNLQKQRNPLGSAQACWHLGRRIVRP